MSTAPTEIKHQPSHSGGCTTLRAMRRRAREIEERRGGGVRFARPFGEELGGFGD